MLNSYFNLPQIIVDDYNFSNIFPTYKNLNILQSFIDSNPILFYYIDLPDDSRLELISYNEYNDSKYWDVLFYINNMENIFDLPTNYDNLNDEINKKISDYVDLVGSITQENIDKIKTNILNNNEKHRRFRMVKKDYLKQVVNIIN